MNLLRPISMSHQWLLALVLSAAILLPASASLHAAVIVVPNANASVEGNSNNGFPFEGTSVRYQQVFASSQFGSLTGPSLLTQIALRPDAAVALPFAGALTDVEIRFSTTSAGPDSLSTTFASNVGADNTTVRDGPLTLTTANLPGPGGTRAFDILIPFTTPFLYNPAAGNLLLDVTNFGGVTGALTYDAHNAAADPISRILGANATALTGLADSSGLVVQFTFGPSAIPEPSTYLLLIAGLGIVAWVARRRSGNLTVSSA